MLSEDEQIDAIMDDITVPVVLTESEKKIVEDWYVWRNSLSEKKLLLLDNELFRSLQLGYFIGRGIETVRAYMMVTE